MERVAPNTALDRTALFKVCVGMLLLTGFGLSIDYACIGPPLPLLPPLLRGARSGGGWAPACTVSDDADPMTLGASPEVEHQG